MTFQSLKELLQKKRSWYVVLTQPKNELKTKKVLEEQGLIIYLPFTPVRRRWRNHIKEIRIPLVTRCVFIYVSEEEVDSLKKCYPMLKLEVDSTMPKAAPDT